MEWFEGAILGLIQGLTEFLPVSSSGHLVIAKELFGIESQDLVFEVTVHAATVLATICVFWKEIAGLFAGLFRFKWNSETRYIAMILISMIPVGIVGVFFKDYVEEFFGNGLTIIGFSLLITGNLLLLSESIQKKQVAKSAPQKDMSFKSAIWMGIAQAFAVLPGLSRSGSTIATGLICGVKKSEVAKFSFLMVLIPVLGEAFLDVVGGEFGASSVSVSALIAGFVTAFASGIFACKSMIEIVKRTKLTWFAIYCFVVSMICIISSLF